MVSSSIPSSPSRVTNNKGSIDDVITINEKVNLTKQQHQVLKIICNGTRSYVAGHVLPSIADFYCSLIVL
jgi:hypothetical protein